MNYIAAILEYAENMSSLKEVACHICTLRSIYFFFQDVLLCGALEMPGYQISRGGWGAGEAAGALP